VAVEDITPHTGIISIRYHRLRVKGDVEVGCVALRIGVIPIEIGLEDVARDIDIDRSRCNAV
jgi:hypothetical protein